jgi:hypothetical protein
MEQVREGIRSPSSDRPYFTPGFSLSLPLRHTTRIAGFDKEQGQYPQAGRDSPIVSDTGELTWHHSQKGNGLVTVETEKSQALIGFVKDNNRELKNLSAAVENEFCSIILTSLDGQPISSSGRLLLVATARLANTKMTWNESRTSLSDWGAAPTLIEPVKGKVTLRNLKPSPRIEILPLNGAGKAAADPLTAQGGTEDFTFDIGLVRQVGEPATTWYLITVRR